MTAKLCFTYVTPTVNEVVSLPAFKYAGAAGTTEYILIGVMVVQLKPKQ